MALSSVIDPNVGSSNTMELKNTEKRDTLIAIEKKYQKLWQEEKLAEVDAPSTSEIPFSTSPSEIRKQHPKFFATMAYPYMNGTLHAGHSFTASKVEYSVNFARMQGKRVLHPLGFHCTGMPIKACADKLVKEVKMYGKNFENYGEEDEEEPTANGTAAAPVQGAKKEDITKFSSNKSKAKAKTGGAKRQFQIMMMLGIPKEEIHKFSNAEYWLHFFPPLCQADLTNFGARIDWRRKMVTTDANPYYDAFVRWQMNRLREKKKILYGQRYTIFSPRDGQPCMDHDRQTGEGVKEQEYTALKLQVKAWSEAAEKLVEGKIAKDVKVYFIPATLRPETMYGQVCCFVGPQIEYGIFRVGESEYYVCTKRAAWNMCFQGTFFGRDHFPTEEEELKPVVSATGTTFVGTLVNAPLSMHTKGVRILPMDSVKESKGTGVVTSVPSDSPDDYATMRDLAKKADYYGIKKEWAELEIMPLIRVPKYAQDGTSWQKGDDVDLIAKYMVEKLKINSPKDADQLAIAKDDAYKQGYFNGIMLIGEFKGDRVEDAKPKIRKALIDSGEALAFADPNGAVESRSGQDCVVAYMGQWYLNYGPNDKEWQETVLNYINAGNTPEMRKKSVFDNQESDHALQTYTEETGNNFAKNIEWLNQWACARTYGLGSKLPFDKSFLVESLSDSTIYMSYYTISHFLHGDEFGRTPGKLSIKADQMTDEVWDYLLGGVDNAKTAVEKSGISLEDLQTMRRSFQYWYPLDMRISGKDLIQNHLTFFLYVHLALIPKEFWPRSVRANGHLTINGAKMSKSTGNFLTLSTGVAKFGADAYRITLADSGDGVDDANFVEVTADRSIIRLFELKEWIEETMKDDSLRKGSEEIIWDKLFADEMNTLVHETRQHYEATNYKQALKSGLYDFLSARDFYRERCASAGVPMSHEMVKQYVKLQSLMLTPIAPHWPEYMWREVLGEKGSIRNALWPEVPVADRKLTATREYIQGTSRSITSAEGQAVKKQAKGKATSFDPKKPKKITIYVAKSFPAWQKQWVELVQEEHKTGTPDRANEAIAEIKGKERGVVQKFVGALRDSLKQGDVDAVFARELPFDEMEVLNEMEPGLIKTTGCKQVAAVTVGEDKAGLPPQALSAEPGKPTFVFENVEG